MMDELAVQAKNIADYANEQDRFQMLAYSALEGSTAGKERLFRQTGIAFDEPAASAGNGFPPFEETAGKLMDYHCL